MTNNGRFCGCALSAMTLLSGCAAGPHRYGRDRDEVVRSQIAGIIARQMDAWNRGDIDGFMDAYWRSPDLTFSSGGSVVRGWQETLDRYRRRYPDRKAMGQLKFYHLELTRLGPDAVLALGHWELQRDEPVDGVFTLIWRRIDGRWVIVHDHTSATEP